MRKILIALVLILMLGLCGVFIFQGTTTLFTIYNMDEIAAKQTETNNEITKVKTLQTETLKSKISKLSSSVKEYEEAKEQYEDMLVFATDEQKEQAVVGDFYDIEFLWTVLGTYSTKLGVDVTMTISDAGTSNTDSSNYKLCNLGFEVVGDYIGVTDYIYAIEDDDLGFSISDFKMLPDGDKVTATFTLEQVPVSTSTLSSLESSGALSSDVGEDGLQTDTGTTSGNTTSNSTNSTSNNTSSNTTNSTTNSTNSSNTTNTTN